MSNTPSPPALPKEPEWQVKELWPKDNSKWTNRDKKD